MTKDTWMFRALLLPKGRKCLAVTSSAARAEQLREFLKLNNRGDVMVKTIEEMGNGTEIRFIGFDELEG